MFSGKILSPAAGNLSMPTAVCNAAFIICSCRYAPTQILC